MTRFCDGYADQPRSRRGMLEERIRELRARLWSDPGDRLELEQMIEELQEELRACDAKRS